MDLLSTCAGVYRSFNEIIFAKAITIMFDNYLSTIDLDQILNDGKQIFSHIPIYMHMCELQA